METNEIMNLIHILIVGPILINVGYRKKSTSKMVFNILLIIGVAVMIYHTYLFFKQLNKKAVKEQVDELKNEKSNNKDLEDEEEDDEEEDEEEEVIEKENFSNMVNESSFEAFNGYVNYSELN